MVRQFDILLHHQVYMEPHMEKSNIIDWQHFIAPFVFISHFTVSLLK